MANEASGALEMAAYERDVLEIEMRLVKEVAGVCRDYCTKVWAEALNQARIPIDTKLRRAGNIYFPKDIQKVPAMLPPSITDPFLPHKQLSIIQAPSLDAEGSTRADKGKGV